MSFGRPTHGTGVGGGGAAVALKSLRKGSVHRTILAFLWAWCRGRRTNETEHTGGIVTTSVPSTW